MRRVAALAVAPALTVALAMGSSLSAGHASGTAGDEGAQRPQILTAEAPSAPVMGRTVAPRRAKGSLTLASIGKRNVPLHHVGTTKGGDVAVPADVSSVGWWKGSASFGSKEGSSIIAGHVSDTSDSPGALYELTKVKKGDRIVWRQGGKKKVFKVTKKTLTPRTGQLPERIWRLAGPRTINLVSCAKKVTSEGGFFHYTHNITITAKLVKKGKR
ncbi:class F sortase [Nocardioides sp. Bht2]|uniref:class F sortase n=1 Tax=Nocardioides sp. Bht2 TaxID=3392297 RepID=UPI0039B4E4D0